jgi:ATP phosphoribosyltransferase
MKSLRMGLPSKGRLAEQAAELLAQAGLSFRRQERSLFARVSEMPVEMTFLRTEDIPVLCAEGAIDLGITGSDLVAESGVELVSRLALGIGRCRLSVCVAEDSPVHAPLDLQSKRVATSFPHVTERFFSLNHTQVHLVPLSGSVEIMVSLGVADAIVDLVETGSTLAANRLRVLTDIGHYGTSCPRRKRLPRVTTRPRSVRWRTLPGVRSRSWSSARK